MYDDIVLDISDEELENESVLQYEKIPQGIYILSINNIEYKEDKEYKNKSGDISRGVLVTITFYIKESLEGNENVEGQKFKIFYTLGHPQYGGFAKKRYIELIKVCFGDEVKELGKNPFNLHYKELQATVFYDNNGNNFPRIKHLKPYIFKKIEDSNIEYEDSIEEFYDDIPFDEIPLKAIQESIDDDEIPF